MTEIQNPHRTYSVHHIQTGSFTTRYLVAGDQDADVVVLLHDGAWGGSSDVSWSRCIPLLADRYRVIAPDFLGFGGSDKATFFDRSPYTPRIRQIESLLGVLGITSPVHVVGTSFGGSVALRILSEGQLAARSVTSIGGSGGPWKTDVMKTEMGRWDGSRDDLTRVLRFLMDDGDAYFQAQVEARYKSATLPGHYRAVASAAMPVPEALRRAESDAWPEALAGIGVPTLVVTGEQDRLFEPDWPEHVAGQLANAAVERMNTLHSPNLDHPVELTEVLFKHFRRSET